MTASGNNFFDDPGVLARAIAEASDDVIFAKDLQGRYQYANPAMLAVVGRAMEEVLGTLSDRERKVLILRFGLEDGRPRTLEEVGSQFGVTRERIRQIEKAALKKLRFSVAGAALAEAAGISVS